ncbi:MAG: Zn-dependent oligopeptidase [Chloroflexota bacterium]|nr:Zn-dependent oligopeptidase [Chloroflexota bacterium]
MTDTPAALVERSRRTLREAEALVERIERTAGSDRAAVLEPFDQAWLLSTTVGLECGLLKEVHPDPGVRKAAEDLSVEVTRFGTRLHHSRPLYDALERVAPADADEARLVDVVRHDMKNAGVELDDEGRRRVLALREELTDLAQDFQRHGRDDVRAIEIAPDRLAGMPEDFIRDHPVGANGRVRITTDYPDYFPFMDYADDAAARKELHRELSNRATPVNLEILTTLIRRKHELAGLLGYRSWAEYQTDRTIAGSAAGVRSFLKEVAEIARPRVRRETEQLLAAKRRREPGATAIGDWDRRYLEQKVKADEIGFDARDARPYLEYDAVRRAILDLNSELFGIEFARSAFTPWHPSVETFEVAIDGAHSGRISLDMHPRAGKYKHAANFGYQPGAGGRQETHSVLVCNFPDPNASTGPALMDHSEVVTYFHEFGHLVHSLMRGRLRWGRLARPVEFDFIEAPSQFLEQWIFDPSVLRRFARHVRTGEPIPEGMVAKLREARDFGRGVDQQRMAFMSMVSLELHDRDPRDIDVMKVWHEIAREWSPTEMDPEGHFPASWTHMPGYASMYYTYQESKTVAESLSSGFTHGLMDVAQARRYRDIVLAQGGRKPALALVEEFLGRPHDLSAFRRWLG